MKNRQNNFYVILLILCSIYTLLRELVVNDLSEKIPDYNTKKI